MIYFQGGALGFREITEDDLPLLTEMRNDFSTWTQLGDPRVLKPGLQRRWLESLNQKADTLYFMAIPMIGDHRGKPVGLVRMDEYDQVNRSMRVGADVVPTLRHRSFGDQIYDAIESYCFDFLGLHRIWLLVRDGNEVGRHLYLKRGFKLEGRMRSAIFRWGKWIDYLMMSMLEPEYRKKRKNR